MELGYKEQLSSYIESIFKGYNIPGLHICDLATGGGKSFTISKLTCEYYPEYFDRIIILCVQNKLVRGMYEEITEYLASPQSKSIIREEDILVIQNNREVIQDAIENGTLNDLVDELAYRTNELSQSESRILKSAHKRIKNIVSALKNFVNALKEQNGKNEYLVKQIEESEKNLRYELHEFFEKYRKIYEAKHNIKRLSVDNVLKTFTNLEKVYPQIGYQSKRVLLLTVHKAMCGIDPILSEKVDLVSLNSKNRRTLILFDESDQAAQAMREVIINQSTDQYSGQKKFGKGYNGFLEYRALINSPEQVSNGYYKNALEEAIKRGKKRSDKIWKNTMKDTDPVNNIFLPEDEDIEDFRRGVFFCGPTLQLNIHPKEAKEESFICHKSNAKEFIGVFSREKKELEKNYDTVVPLNKFLSCIQGCTTAIKSELSEVVKTAFENSKKKFEEETKAIASNSNPEKNKQFMGYPTLERETHTLFSRFVSSAQRQFERQLQEYITNRKSMVIKRENEKDKYPDNTIYSQGFQFYEIELDEYDNQHKIDLSCREINTTPEKIILDLLSTESTSVVLCSATASCDSVISNFDMSYLTNAPMIMGKIHNLEDKYQKFDELVEKTYPKGHQVKIIPIEKYTDSEVRTNRLVLPSKYREMFCSKALEEGLVDKWFKATIRQFQKETATEDTESNKGNDIKFHLGRIYQFIDAYHYFYTHDDIHSMLYFQNKKGDDDKKQFHVISSLIDGSYPPNSTIDNDRLPDWENEHICISRKIDEVNEKIIKELSRDKEKKIMLISAYGSFKAGTNMQYEIPDGADCIIGDNWQKPGQRLKKDWDAVYLQSPTSYLTMYDDDSNTDYEKNLYNVMLSLMMLYNRGYLSKANVKNWLYYALTGNFMFGAKNNPGIMHDKAAWARTTVEQAVGRLCRTKNKPRVTHILYDTEMSQYFSDCTENKSLTKEFRELKDFITKHNKVEFDANVDQVILYNNANYVSNQLAAIRRIALKYTPKKNQEIEEIEEIEENEVPQNVISCQKLIANYKNTIIRKPVLKSLKELDTNDRLFMFMDRCYGKWDRDDEGSLNFNYNQLQKRYDIKGKEYPLDSSKVRLDILMKNPVIRDYFQQHGYSTEWGEGEFILHPDILANDYAGEIGEEAFKALVLHYTNCTESDIRHLSGFNYELADFALFHPDGTIRIAFDVKNMRSKPTPTDGSNDMEIQDKRAAKVKRLGCNLITVNMLEIKEHPTDSKYEIFGLIDDNGEVINSNMDYLKKLIENR